MSEIVRSEKNRLNERGSVSTTPSQARRRHGTTVKPRRSIGMRRGDTGCYAMRHIATRVASWSNEPTETKEEERAEAGAGLAFKCSSLDPKRKEITEQAP